MKNDLLSLIGWFQSNKLSLNLSKTDYVLFKPNRLHNIDNTDIECSLDFGTDKLEQKECFKFLGAYLDQYLDWSTHFNYIRGKLQKSVYIMNRVKRYVPFVTMKTLYYSLFYSHINYALHVWGPSLSAKLSKCMQTLQKKVLRIMTNSSYNASTGPLFKENMLLKVPDLINVKLIKLMYCFVDGNLPIPLMKMFKANKEIHNYPTRGRNDCCIIKSNYDDMKRSFLCKGPSLWSSLKNDIKSAPSVKSCVNRYKKYSRT